MNLKLSKWAAGMLIGWIVVSAISTHAGEPPIQKKTVTDSTKENARIILRVEKKYIVNRRISDTIDISLESFGRPIAGFDLKFGTDSPYLDIVKVLPGKFYDSCGWQFFNAHPVLRTGKQGLPRQLWQAVALAKMMSDTLQPRCYGLDGETSLLRLVVSNEHALQMPEAALPIFFFWEDCTDNVMSGQSGSDLVISLNVIDYFPVTFEENGSIFPTRRGAPRNCVNPQAKHKPLRIIEFNNGGIDFRYNGNATPDSGKIRGRNKPIDPTSSDSTIYKRDTGFIPVDPNPPDSPGARPQSN
ncbi:MAG: hypothetical protein WAU88_08560 [Candidatus Zixiibacteriota bacterium]